MFFTNIQPAVTGASLVNNFHIFVAPLPATGGTPGGTTTGQLTAFALDIDSVVESGDVVLLVPGNAHLCALDAEVDAFFADLHACFPSTVTVRPGDEAPTHSGHISFTKSPIVAPGAHAHTHARVRVISVPEAAALVPLSVRRLITAPEYVHGYTALHVRVDATHPVHHLAVAFTHGRLSEHLLWAPNLHSASSLGDEHEMDPAASLMVGGSGVHLFSVGTARRDDGRGGGKTSDETFEDLRHRFASGSFKKLLPAQRSWSTVRNVPDKIRVQLHPLWTDVAPAMEEEAVSASAVAGGVVGGTMELSPAVDAAPSAASSAAHASVSFDVSTMECDGHVRAGGEGDGMPLTSARCVDTLRLRKFMCVPTADVVLQLNIPGRVTEHAAGGAHTL